MSDYRMMTAMVVFKLEQELGSYVSQRSPEIDQAIQDIATSIIDRESKKRPNLSILNTSQLIAETYIEDLFQLALRVTKETADFAPLNELKKLCSNLSLNEIRNAVAHPNRPFPDCYWYRVAAIATDPLIQQLNFKGLVACLAAAIEGKIVPPPEEWMSLPEWIVPNNLPKTSDFDITGLIGRPKEIADLNKYLSNPRANTIAIVAPGGVGKTALALDVLSRSCKSPEFSKYFQAIVFVTLKVEKLTAEGVIKLDAPSSIAEIESQLSNTIPQALGEDGAGRSFDKIKEDFGDVSILLFVDNLETLLLDDPNNFNEFQIGLPISWRLLVTSRIAINSATCLALPPLTEQHSKHLARLYSVRRGSANAFTDEIIDKVVQRTRCNPLAIRLAVDAYILGSPLNNSLDSASRDVLNFSYKNLLEVISPESGTVLECLFLEDSKTRIELAESIGSPIDAVAMGLAELNRTSLITRDNSEEQERYSLYPAVRDVLLVAPINADLRLQIQKRLLIKKESAAVDLSRQSKLAKNHPEFIDPDTPDVIRNLCFEANRALRKNARRNGDEVLALIDRLRALRTEYPRSSEIPRQLARIFKSLGDNSSAIHEINDALKLEPNNILLLMLLGRYLHDDRNYKGSVEAYEKISSQGGFDPNVTDEQTARYCYNGYLLALLYAGDNSRILSETHGWSDESSLRDLAGAFRSRAWKRSVENSLNIEERAKALSKSASILDDIHKLYGYPEWLPGFFIELIRGIDDAFKINKFSTSKYALKLLQFAERHISNVFDDNREDLSIVLSISGNLSRVIYEGNPFNSEGWSNFLTTEGGINYDNEYSLDELSEQGFTMTNVYHIPKSDSVFVFTKDSEEKQYFVHLESCRLNQRQLWRWLKEGSTIAVKSDGLPPVQNKAIRAIDSLILN